MLRNFIKLAWRNVLRHKIYSLINVIGLSLGISACLVIYVVAKYEFSFDNFHPDKERIFRIVGEVQDKAGRVEPISNVPPPMAGAIKQKILGIEYAAGFHLYNAKVSVPQQEGPSKEFNAKWQIIVADSAYFSVFNYHWLAGNAATSLDKPFSVVLTERQAMKYFGEVPTENMIGRSIIYDDSLKVTVTGIVADWSGNTDFGFTNFISLSTAKGSFLNKALFLEDWSSDAPHTSIAFVKLAKNVRPSQIEAQLSSLCKENVKLEAGSAFSLQLQPLADVHFNSSYPEYPFRKGYLPILYGLMGAALFILLIAAFNFINLSTAQSIRRIKEIGVRKVLGSSRLTLIFQFLIETLVITVLAICISIALLTPVLATFRSFIPEGATLNLLSGTTVLFLAGLVLATTLLAGLYPAKVISAFLPAESLKGATGNIGGDRSFFRKALIVFQFAASLIFIIGAITLDRQLDFMQSKDLGFSTNSIISIETDRDDSIRKVQFLVQKIRDVAGVDAAALQSFEPMSDEGLNIPVRSPGSIEKRIPAMLQSGDNQFISLYKIRLLAGRNFKYSDSLNELVINETLSKQLGYAKPGDAVNTLLQFGRGIRLYPVVGVVADFHEHSFQEVIRPLIIAHMPAQETSIAATLNTKGKNIKDLQAILTSIEREWKLVYPKTPFAFSFVDDDIALLYQRERDIANLMNSAMIITLSISCIGLFGLAMFAAEQRTKEIGIRKVMGASVTNIAMLLIKDFVTLVIVAFAIASPIAWFAFNRWLQEFAYRTTISWWVFLAAGLSTTLIATATVGFQAIKAGLINPVKSLRTD
jgi:putative ABC transport system permease protein